MDEVASDFARVPSNRGRELVRVVRDLFSLPSMMPSLFDRLSEEVASP